MTPVQIVDCGIISDDEGNDESEKGAKKGLLSGENTTKHPTAKDDIEVELPVEEEEEVPPKTKAEALKRRMRKLKMKMNQARQLNKQEVLREGERLGSVEGAAKARKRQQMMDKKAKELEWKKRNSKALEVAAAAGLDGKHLVEQADASLRKAYKKEQKAVSQQFAVNDYYNPEGQHRNYERNLKSLSRAAGPLPEDAVTNGHATFDPTTDESDEKREREGARNLANELKRRIEKQKEKRNRLEFEGEDVTWINQRNKRFNQKISRNFDKHTAEIRQNLERGTAL